MERAGKSRAITELFLLGSGAIQPPSSGDPLVGEIEDADTAVVGAGSGGVPEEINGRVK